VAHASVYGQQASARLAKHKLQAKVLTAFAGTSHYNPQDTSYPSVCIPLPMPTADPVLLTEAAHALLPAIHEGVKYARAGIMVTNLRPPETKNPWRSSRSPTRNAPSGRSWKTSADATAVAPSAWVTEASAADPTGP
jgi:DNA polymerase V